MKNKRFFWQIFPAALFIIVLSISSASWYGTRMIQAFQQQQMQEDIKDRALLLRPHIRQLRSGSSSALQTFCRETGRMAATRITVIAGDGTVLGDSNENPAHMDNHATRPEIRAASSGDTGASLRFSKTLSQNMLYVAIPLNNANPSQGVLRLSVSAAALDAMLSTIHRRLLYGILLIALMAAMVSYFLARRISRPIEEMRRSAERLAGGDTNQPITIEGANVPSEMLELAQSLNNMAQQLNARIRTISQQHNELEAVFASMTDGVLAIDPNHSIIRINRAAAELFNIQHQSLQGMNYEAIIRNLELQNFLEHSLNGQESITRELTLMENGQKMILNCHVHPLYDGDNRQMGSLVILNNRTRIKQLESIRQDFVANVSHELKTPITAIRGYVETLLDGALDDKKAAKSFLRIILRQGGRLDAIVDDLLSLARIEDLAHNQKMEFNQEDILPILETVIQTCSVAAQNKDISIEVHCEPESLQGPLNKAMLEQALINLLTNAIAYSPPHSGITLKAEIRDMETAQTNICISVRDQGPGIDPLHQSRVFERFYRCDKARSREHGGTGLGLAIVKHIADCHRGTIELNSQPGQGATFSLIIPMEDNL
jgi:two-component system phosphate regulon sensor histidine kinase PhoR